MFSKSCNSILRAVPLALMALGVSSIATSPASAQALGKNWKVYNVEPATASFWDINRPDALPGGVLQFPIEQFDTKTTGSFAVYLRNYYNFDLTGKTLKTEVSWTDAVYDTRSTACGGAYVRFEFQDVTSGNYTSNDYWWSTGTNSLDLNEDVSGTLEVSLNDRERWSNICGQSATDTVAYPGPNCVGGIDPAVSPYDGFTNAMKDVKQVGLSFGSACRYASGIAIVPPETGGSFKVWTFTITP